MKKINKKEKQDRKPLMPPPKVYKNKKKLDKKFACRKKG